MAGLLSFCRKLPWQVRPADAACWLEQGLAGKTNLTKACACRPVGQFYRFACHKTWTSPSGRCLILCRANPLEQVETPRSQDFLSVSPLSDPELECLLAAFDRQSLIGLRDFALFTVVLETGLYLRQALALRLQDLLPSPA